MFSFFQSLETCLHSFCTSDNLLKADQYRCDACKLKVDAIKSLSISQLPEILCIHIKRFSHNSYFGSKVGRHVSFPLYDLDMSKYCATSPPEIVSALNSGSSQLYNLCGLVRHMGGVSGGHYVAVAKSHTSGKWVINTKRHSYRL